MALKYNSVLHQQQKTQQNSNNKLTSNSHRLSGIARVAPSQKTPVMQQQQQTTTRQQPATTTSALQQQQVSNKQQRHILSLSTSGGINNNNNNMANLNHQYPHHYNQQYFHHNHNHQQQHHHHHIQHPAAHVNRMSGLGYTARQHLSQQRRHIRLREYKNLRQVIPSLRIQRTVSKVEVVSEAARYIDHLHKSLLERFVTEGIPDNLKGEYPARCTGRSHCLSPTVCV